MHNILKAEYEVIFPENGIYKIAVRVKDNDGKRVEKVEIPDFKVK